MMTTTVNNSTPRFSMARNPVYQIDFSALESGKRLAATKRRVRFRFGFSSAEALDEGKTGIACRGEEHEVTLVWSLTSGKRLVLADGHEVHFSKGNLQQTKFDTTWTMRGQHTVKLVAHAAPPLFPTPNFRQFELFIDGMSFFDMPKIYELGVTKGKKSSSVVAYKHEQSSGYRPHEATPYNNYALPPQQQEREEYRQMDRGGFANQDSSVSSAPAFAQAPPQDLVSEDVGPQDYLDTATGNAGLLLDTHTVQTAPAVTTHDEFAPAPPSMTDVHSGILSAYGPAPTQPALPALAAESHTYAVPPPAAQQHYQAPPPPQPQQQQHYQAPPPQQQQQQQHYYQAPPAVQVPAYAYTPAQGTTPMSQLSTPSNFASPPPQQQQQQAAPQPPPQPTTQLTMMSYTDPAAIDVAVDEADPSDVGRALANLVNLDDISQDPNTPEKLKEAALKRHQEEEQARKKSKPLPPARGDWQLGPQASLGQIKETVVKPPPQREVMRTHAFDPAAAQAGMMVLYGASAAQPQQTMPGHLHVGGFGMAQAAPAIGAYY